jgi:hypothetical protein
VSIRPAAVNLKCADDAGHLSFIATRGPLVASLPAGEILLAEYPLPESVWKRPAIRDSRPRLVRGVQCGKHPFG